jgi:hydrogenase-4 component B
MPLTWVAFLVGSAAIVGLPPLNGFVSEWVVFQALVRGVTSDGPIRLTLVGVAGLALVGGLALACFAKVCGIVFLGTPRSEAAARGHEAAPGLVAPMFGLAAACALIGLAPGLVARPALAVGAAVAHVAAGAAGSDTAQAVTRIGLLSLLLVALLGLGSVAWGALRRARRRHTTHAETWGCGYALPDARMQYTASSFAAPLLASYGPLAGVHETRSPAAFHSHARELVLEGAILPAWTALRGLLWRLRPIQQGRLWMYLLYLIAVVLLLLLYLAGLVP